MTEYNYREAVLQDVLEAISEHYTQEEIADKMERPDDFADELEAELWMDDSVTGNASGSYTCNAWEAEEYLAHNWELMEETAEMFDGEARFSTGYKYGPEYWDVSIRCYLLPEAIQKALEELREEYAQEEGV